MRMMDWLEGCVSAFAKPWTKRATSATAISYSALWMYLRSRNNMQPIHCAMEPMSSDRLRPIVLLPRAIKGVHTIVLIG